MFEARSSSRCRFGAPTPDSERLPLARARAARVRWCRAPRETRADSPLEGTFLPTIRLDTEFLSLLVAVIGTTLVGLSLHVAIERGGRGRDSARSHALGQRQGATDQGFRRRAATHFRDVVLEPHHVLYHSLDGRHAPQDGPHDIESAADAAEALHPLLRESSGLLFADGMSRRFPRRTVMTTGRL